MKTIPPPGFLALGSARDILMQHMYRGVPPSENTITDRETGVHVVDGKQATAAAKVLRQAIRQGELALFALFPSRDTPMRLYSLALIEAALCPPNSTVLTFAYCERHSQAPFGLSWSDLKELSRDPLCLNGKEFRRWLRRQEYEKQWPCHASTARTRNPRGRPPVIHEVVEAPRTRGRPPSIFNRKSDLTQSGHEKTYVVARKLRRLA
jgi:hypothetical protein